VIDLSVKKQWYNLSYEAQDSLVFLVLMLVCGVVVIQPLSLPLAIQPETKKYYDILTGLPNGSVMVYDEAMMNTAIVSGWEIDTFRIMFDMIRQKQYKLVLFSSCVDGPLGGAYIQSLLDQYVDKTGTTYGVDYVNFGWLPGFELVLAAVKNDIQTVTTKDAYGTPISNIPMMKGLKTSDIKLLGFSCGVSPDPWMRQWASLNLPMLMSGDATLIALGMQYYNAGLVTSFINGSRGYAELEKLDGRFTIATALMDATNLVSLYGVGLIILTNAWFWTTRRKK